jgi:hypothetical protein
MICSITNNAFVISLALLLLGGSTHTLVGGFRTKFRGSSFIYAAEIFISLPEQRAQPIRKIQRRL